MFVIKADGSKQEFDKNKIVRTCIRMRLDEEAAKEVADRIEKRIVDGTSTRQILKMIFSFVKDYRPAVRHIVDLRESISLLRPKPDFEEFVRLILNEYGYETSGNQFIKGRCVEHEIDGIVRKGKDVLLLEIKHHYQHHTYTGLGIILEANSTLEDIQDGFGRNHTIKFNRALIVCNTKFSIHAIDYAGCKEIELIGWNMPIGRGLETMIGGKKLYPITFLKILDKNTERKLADNGIVLLKQLIEMDVQELKKRTKIKESKLNILKKRAMEII